MASSFSEDMQITIIEPELGSRSISLKPKESQHTELGREHLACSDQNPA